ncbi:helix-turn-helix domain-containing protein [Vulcanisaeta thermophila]|uniref:helix-turn-helix domain-containing protein n=1 Tax=Vulcanisaeta thermophila TaxID=867917 RepID=UPI000852972B|nr:helix-turn-helix domain-containing protein [Vulcanisaeta thermophila]
MWVHNVVSLITLKEKSTEEILEDVDIRYILRCILRLSPTEVEIYYLLQHKAREPMTVAEIAKEMGKSRSTIERSLVKLVQLGLVARRPVLAKNGGYTYVYYTKPVDYIKQKLLQLVNAYYEKSKQLIENLSSAALMESLNSIASEEYEENKG